MFTSICRSLVFLLLLSAAVVQSARAQWAVVDAPAIVQLVQQVKVMESAVQTAREQLAQAKQELQAMTGDRGMALLLAGITRNYLPSSWTQLTSVMQGGGYSSLAVGVRNALGANAVLTAQQMSALTASERQQVIAARQSNALRQALVEEALANASGRFASIQNLIAAISTASDQKGVLDLQARIGAELGMLQNEQTKLQTLYQATQANDSVNRAQEREQIIAGHGRFESRFQPVP